MFAQFNAFKRPITIVNKNPEYAVFARVGKSSSSNFKSNFVYSCLLQENTKLENGDVFTAKTGIGQKENTFLVVSVRRADSSIQATVYRCNGIAHIIRAGETTYDENDMPIEGETRVIADVPANHVTVNAQMRALDAGLLPSTTKEFRLPICDIKELDRIVLDGENFCVDDIECTKFDGVLAVQRSKDKRNR